MQKFPLSFLDRDTIDALEGTNGNPSDTNKYVTESDSSLSDTRTADSIIMPSGTISIVEKTPVNGSVLTVNSDLNLELLPVPGHAQEVDPSLHAVATHLDNGFMPSSDKQKLDGISIATATPASLYVGSPSDIGTSTKYAKEDHSHGINSDIPVSIGSSNDEGTSTSVSRSDHKHEHGSRDNPNDHATATTFSNGFMSSSDKQKLDEFVASGAISSNRFNLYEDELETTSTSNQLFHTWTTPEMEAGTYLIRWMFTFSTQTYAIPAVLTLNIDGIQQIQHIMASAYNGDESIGAIGIAQITFATDSAHTLQSYLRRGGSYSRWVKMNKSYFELIRVL